MLTDGLGNIPDTTPLFVISVAAQLAGMHPQTLRQYDRLGLVSPTRTAGRGRRYSTRDIAQLRQVQRLSQDEGVNLAGIRRILQLQLELLATQEELAQVQADFAELDRQVRSQSRSATVSVFAASSNGQVERIPFGTRPARRKLGSALVVWRPQG